MESVDTFTVKALTTQALIGTKRKFTCGHVIAIVPRTSNVSKQTVGKDEYE